MATGASGSLRAGSGTFRTKDPDSCAPGAHLGPLLQNLKAEALNFM